MKTAYKNIFTPHWNWSRKRLVNSNTEIIQDVNSLGTKHFLHHSPTKLLRQRSKWPCTNKEISVESKMYYTTRLLVLNYGEQTACQKDRRWDSLSMDSNPSQKSLIWLPMMTSPVRQLIRSFCRWPNALLKESGFHRSLLISLLTQDTSTGCTHNYSDHQNQTHAGKCCL